MATWTPGPLQDVSNTEQQPCNEAKRRRLSHTDDPVQAVIDLLQKGGCSGLRTEEPTSNAAAEALQVADPLLLRRILATADAAVVSAGLEACMDHPGTLRQLLLPLRVTHHTAYDSGSSLVRLMLHARQLQTPVITLLLQRLPDYSAADCVAAASLPQLVCGQLRWLEEVVDPAALTATVLEVLPVVPPLVAQQLVGLLPEVATPEEHEAVVASLLGLLASDMSGVAAVLECLGGLQLGEELAAPVLQQVVALLPSVAVEDLPALVRYLLLGATQDTAAGVVAAVRQVLCFEAAADPRLQVPDRKQKGPARAASGADAAVVKELGRGLQASPAAAAAFLQQQAGLTAPQQHRTIDWVVLLLLCRNHGPQQKAAETLLQRKLQEGQAGLAWVTKAVKGHQAMLQDCWPTLLSIAASWAASKHPALAAAAVHLYVLLFVEFEGSGLRQQLLQELHGHLGSGLTAKEDVALQALSCLASRHRPLLAQYGSFLSQLLDHLEALSDAQLGCVFGMLVALTQPAAGASASSSSSAGRGAECGRLQDEVLITLTKAQSHSLVKYKRIGIIGGLALLWHAAGAVGAAEGGPEAAAEEVLGQWVRHADALFTSCRDSPPCTAFLLDQVTHRLALASAPGAPAPPQGAAGGGGVGAAGAQENGSGCGQLPSACLTWLFDKVYDMLQEQVLGDLGGGASQLSQQVVAGGAGGAQPLVVPLEDPVVTQGCTWFNLDGGQAPVYVRIAELALAADLRKREQLVWVAPALRLLAELALRTDGGLAGIDALLGCPLALPAPGWYLLQGGGGVGGWEALPQSSKAGVLLALFHGIGWCREVLNMFAQGVRVPEAGPTQAPHSTQATAALALAVEMHVKVLSRVTQLAAMEALLSQLVAADGALAGAVLPDLGQPLAGELREQGVMGGAGAGRRPGLAVGAAAQQQPQQAASISPAEALRRQRPLALSAQQALSACRPHHLSATLLLPAGYLLGDMGAKLKRLLASRPGGFLPGGAGAGGGPSGAAAPAPAFPGPGGSDPVVVLQQLVPLLPLVVQHLSLAVGALQQPPEGGDQLLVAELYGLEDVFPTLAASDPLESALRLQPALHGAAVAALQVLTLLLQHSRQGPPGFITHLLAAVAGQAAPGGPSDSASGEEGTPEAQLQQLAPQAFAAASAWSCLQGGGSDLALERAVLSCRAALVVAVTEAGMVGPAVWEMRAGVAQGAADLLKESWGVDEEAVEDGRGFNWKGHASDIAELLQQVVSCSEDPPGVLAGLVAGPLAAVPGKVAAKQQLEPVAGWAALCSSTFLVWYRVLLQQACKEIEVLVAAALQLVEQRGGGDGATGGGRSVGAGKRKARAAAGGQDVEEWDPEQVVPLIAGMQHCADAFAGLMLLTRSHPHRTGVLGQALKLGAKFISVWVRSLPFWRAAFTQYERDFRAAAERLQKGTKVLQNICNEGKVRRGAGSLVSRAPVAKRALEGLLHKMRELTCTLGIQDLLYLGTLKHRDLAGNAVGSQMFPDELGDEEAASEEEEDPGTEDEEA